MKIYYSFQKVSINENVSTVRRHVKLTIICTAAKKSLAEFRYFMLEHKYADKDEMNKIRYQRGSSGNKESVAKRSIRP